MDRHSLKFKFSMILAALTLVMVGTIVFVNVTFAEKYYSSSIQNNMLDNYNDIDFYVKSYDEGSITQDEMNDSLEALTSSCGVALIIVRRDWSTFYSSESFDGELLKRLQMSFFNSDRFNHEKPDKVEKETSEYPFDDLYNGIKDDSQLFPNLPPQDKKDDDGSRIEFTGIHEERDILEVTGDYTLQKVYDHRLDDSYFELWGSIADGEYSLLIRHPYQSIVNAVGVMNKFICIVAFIVLVIAIIAVYILAGYLTNPIKELSVVANRMAKLDFGTHYTGDDKSELGKLGQSMNEMSGELENAISHLKSANLELQRDLENKEKLEEMRTEFLSNVSHELKTPIALIQGYAEGLKEGVSNDPESMEYYCDVIIDESAKMNTMVKKLLTLNQLEFGDEELVMERFNLTELVSSVVTANELCAGQKNISMEFSADGDVYVWCDEYKVEEVVTNYISNAINHCSDNGTIRVNITSGAEHARVTVFNTGNHIPEEDIDKIWDKFYKVDKARTREYGGNGIGLSIVKAILDSYGCGYGAENVENGVMFWFELDCKNN